MKKKVVSIFLIFAICLALLPLMSGCKAEESYTLNEAGDGYIFSVKGFSSSFSGEFEIPEAYGEGADRLPVREIASEGFGGSNITKVTIPATVEKIGTAAFSYCTMLREVVFESGSPLTEIAWGSFGYCESLTKINIPDGVTVIEGMSFYGCSSLEEMQIPEGVTGIGQRAFEQCTSLKSVTLPSTLTTIGEMAFYTAGLESVTIPDGVHDIQTPVLNEDGETVYQLVRGIGRAAFHTCTSLKTARIGSGVTTIYSGTFGYCTSLEEIYLPASVKIIEGALFSNGNFSYGHAFHNDTKLADIYFGGTQEEWEELKKNTDNTPYSKNGASYDNKAFLNATMHFV